MSETKERPILFSAPMVRAILGGAKTQTRRAMKPQPLAWGRHGGLQLPGYRASTEGAFRNGAPIFDSRFGRVGGRLWVREAFQRFGDDGEILYRADPQAAEAMNELRRNGCLWARWCPSIHMPRSLSRIMLEITNTRVERLQDISEADAIAEGVTPKWEPGCSGRLMEAFSGFSFRPAASAYADLWEQINGPGSWDANPWVWVVEFRRLGASHA
jgi:hypothetical protein